MKRYHVAEGRSGNPMKHGNIRMTKAALRCNNIRPQTQKKTDLGTNAPRRRRRGRPGRLKYPGTYMLQNSPFLTPRTNYLDRRSERSQRTRGRLPPTNHPPRTLLLTDPAPPPTREGAVTHGKQPTFKKKGPLNLRNRKAVVNRQRCLVAHVKIDL